MPGGLSTRLFVTPSLKVTGGNLELVRLAKDCQHAGYRVAVVAMMRAPHEVSLDGLELIRLSDRKITPFSLIVVLPTIARRFRRAIRQAKEGAAVFTHYATFPLALLAPRQRRWFFVQDTEWEFVKGRLLQALLKKVILEFLRRGNIISANPYLTCRLDRQGLHVRVQAPIWADRRYAAPITPASGWAQNCSRPIDVVVMLRRGAHKRADLTIELLHALAEAAPDLHLAAISPDDSFRSVVPSKVTYLERPSMEEMRDLYSRAKIFALLSEHEGFGLPPLEAMGQGCVPVCRNSGGVSNYMDDELASNILALTLRPAEIADYILALVADRPRWAKLSEATRRIFARGEAAASNRASLLQAAGF